KSMSLRIKQVSALEAVVVAGRGATANSTKVRGGLPRAVALRFQAKFRDEPARFVDAHDLVGGEILERPGSAGWPFDIEPGHARVCPEAESQRELALRGVARPAVHHLPLRARRARHTHPRADPAAVRPRSDRPYAQPVPSIAAVISN